MPCGLPNRKKLRRVRRHTPLCESAMDLYFGISASRRAPPLTLDAVATPRQSGTVHPRCGLSSTYSPSASSLSRCLRLSTSSKIVRSRLRSSFSSSPLPLRQSQAQDDCCPNQRGEGYGSMDFSQNLRDQCGRASIFGGRRTRSSREMLCARARGGANNNKTQAGASTININN